MPPQTPAEPLADRPPGIALDLALVALLTVCSGLLSAHYEVYERVFALTRGYEHLQLDEWPIVALVLALCLMWVAWRRYRLATGEVRARLVTEARLRESLAENRELARRHLHAIEEERKRLARELHDEFGQYLNAIRLDAVGGATDEDADARRDRAQRMLLAVDHIHRAAGDMMRRLRPAALDELGLTAAIEDCIENWQRRLPGIRFSFHATGALDRLPEQTGLTLYRVVQEALTNAFRHAAGAKSVDIVLNRSPHDDAGGDVVVLSISDDGAGTAGVAHDAGLGLRGMRERVGMLGGTLTLDTLPGQGFTVEVRLPGNTRP